MQINGARWWKFDFHTHTPASHDYGKGSNQETLKARSPRKWLLDHMKAEIDCVAVTDHNSGAWVDRLKEELKVMKEEKIVGFRPLVIFPGVEISVNGGIHLLALFDPSATSEDISNLLGAVDYQGTRGETDGCTNKSFSQVVHEIVRRNGIAIPAHVDEASGLFKETQGVTLRSHLASDGLLAIQVCDPRKEKPQIYKEMKLNFAEVAGSDSHRPEQVGQAYSWVKMEIPDITALRLALHDGEDGILRHDTYSGNPNDVGTRFFIQNITVTNGAKAGRGTPLKVSFSPWLTTLIGGRGSGKSSVLQYLRLALDNKDSLPESLKREFDEFAQVCSGRGKTGMLTKNTEIRVELKKDGRDVALVWKDNQITEEQKDEIGNWVVKERSNIVQKRFPVRMFSQKQLFEMTKDPQVVLKLIDRQFDKSQWQEKRDELEKQWLESRRLEREYHKRLLELPDIRAELDDVRAKMKIFEDSDHKELLTKYQLSRQIQNEINVMEKSVVDYLSSVDEAVRKCPKLWIQELLFENLDEDSLAVLNQKINEWRKINDKLYSVVSELKNFEGSWNVALSQLPWHKVRIENEKAYTELVQKLREVGAQDASGYGNLVQRRQELEKKLREIEEYEEKYKSQLKHSEKIKAEILEHEKSLRQAREQVIRTWNSKNENIRISLNVMGDTTQGEQSFRNLIRKTNGEYARDILDRDELDQINGGFLHQLATTEITSRWSFLEEFKHRLTTATETDQKGFGKPLIRHIDALRNTTPEDIDRLLCWYPEDQVVLKLWNNGREEDIEVGSAGQRTAAMLSLLLSIDDTPLIIDQPEDDLDNRKISTLVVNGLRQLKSKQQVIVVTHNPNIPVNGGAEQIVHLNFAGGGIRVQASGALQNSNVRHAVCEVMEGGQEALSNRYYRIFKALEPPRSVSI